MTAPPSPDTLYLRRVRVRDMRCFGDIEVSFERDDKPRPFTLLLGGNGSGKSTLLRAIALGLCQQRETSGLIGRLSGDFIRQDKQGVQESEASIEIDLIDPARPEQRFVLTTKVTRNASGEEITERITEPDTFPWPAIFVCGYGVNRGAGQREGTPSSYRRADAVQTLFTDDAALLDPEEVLKNLKLAAFEANTPEAVRQFDNVVRHLKYLLQLHSAHNIEISASSVSVRGPWGSMPFHALGDGYRGTSGWLLDLWSRASLADRLPEHGKPAGIVLIDEIDEHLHPSWQKKIVTLLKRRFPKIQFVGTTHSVMSIVNCEPDELLAAELKATGARLLPLADPEGKSADRLLRGEWFGLTSTLDDDSEDLLKRYEKAVREGQPEADLAPLRDQLRDRIGYLVESPLDELALEIAAETRKRFRHDTPPERRREIIAEAATKLRERLAELNDAESPA